MKIIRELTIAAVLLSSPALSEGSADVQAHAALQQNAVTHMEGPSWPEGRDERGDVSNGQHGPDQQGQYGQQGVNEQGEVANAQEGVNEQGAVSNGASGQQGGDGVQGQRSTSGDGNH